MTDIRFLSVETREQQDELANMAEHIWNEYWPRIIGQEQTSYMVDRFQSPDAIRRDISENGYEYWLVSAIGKNGSDRIIGYTGGHTESDSGRFFISKIYLLKEDRGKGISSQIVGFYEKLCQNRGLHTMYLTVNKHNELGINAYKKNGFEIADAVRTDIGSGFVMDDYIMEKKL